MDAEVKKQQETRAVLEDIAKGKNLTDTVLVPLMQANDFDVIRCVDVLLEMISDPLPSAEVVANEARLKEEKKQLEQFRRQLDVQRKLEEAAMLKPKTQKDVISAELKQKEELERKRLEAVEQERKAFAKMRADLEQEWEARMAEQQRELDVRKKQIEEDRRRVLGEQLKVVGAARSPDFQAEVEALLQKRLEEEKRKTEQQAKDVKERQDVQVQDGGAAAAAAGGAAGSETVVIEVTCPPSAEMGSRITVYWEYKLGRPSRSDWIGYFKRSRDPDSRDYYTYQKTGGADKGSIEFVVPSKLGICELRFFQNNSYVVAARSGPIRVGNAVTVQATLKDGVINAAVQYADKTKDHSTWDWLGLYSTEEKNNRSYFEGMCAYVTKDVVPFQAPRKPGRYVIRYFQSGSGYSELATSNMVEIEDHDVLKVIVPSGGAAKVGETVEVVWRIESINPALKDWVGLFREGEFNPLAPLAMLHTHATKPDGSLKFILSRGLTPDQYEFVFVQARSGTIVKRSLPFKVE